jgi:hypothetical protein
MDYLTNRQAAEVMKIHHVTLARWRTQGRGPVYKKCGDTPCARVRYSRADVEKWMKQNNWDPEWEPAAEDPESPPADPPAHSSRMSRSRPSTSRRASSSKPVKAGAA